MNGPRYVCDECRDLKCGVAATCPGCVGILRDRLQWISDYVDNHVDVEDGSDGAQLPNWAMSLQIDYEQHWKVRL